MVGNDDLSLLRKAVQAGAKVAKDFWRNDLRVWEKSAGLGPVSDADLAVNDVLRSVLRSERPDYGWLSEEDSDGEARLEKTSVFIVDPIDGTRNFIAGDPVFSLSVGIASKGEITSGVVFLPECGLLFEAAKGRGARLNGAPLLVSLQSGIEKAKVLATKPAMRAENWAGSHPPPFERHFCGPLSYRLCLVAEARFDAMLTLRPTWEWDIAAGCLIASEAGATISNRSNAPICFNTIAAQADGVIAGAPALHTALICALR